MAHFELDDTGPPPIFILSHERSGSTLLRLVVDTHPEIACPAELMLGKLASSILPVIQSSLGEVIPEFQGERGGEEMAREARAVLNGLMKAYARAKGKTIWCEKWPNSSQFLPWFERIFPDARYICLYRDCLDCVHSCLETFSRYGFPKPLAPFVSQRPDNLVAAMCTSWIEDTRHNLELETRKPAKCFRIRYEDYVKDPHATLPAMFEFLGLAWHPSIVEDTFRVHHDGIGKGGDMKVAFTRGFDPSSIGRGRATIGLNRIPRPIQREVNDLLVQLGYPPLRAGAPAARAADEPAPPVGASLPPGVASVADVFAKHVPQMVKQNATIAGPWKGVLKFEVANAEPRVWTVVLGDDGVTISNEDTQADGTMILSEGQLLGIVAGRIRIPLAVANGKIRFDGAKGLITRVAYLFS
jgi:protein-tyrosine sulfotransferase